MSSLWDKNGVDWTNPQKYRTSYLIRELYQATYERYYEAFASTTIIGTSTPIIPESKYYDERDEYAVYNICQMINTMFSDNPQYTTNGTGNSRRSGYIATGCFIDDAYEFDFYPSGDGTGGTGRFDTANGYIYNSYMGGLEYLTLTKLEEYYGDMTFIRDLGVNHRISIDFILKIKAILDHPMKINICIPKPVLNFQGVFQNTWTSVDMDVNTIFRHYLRTKEDDNLDTSTDDAVSSMEADTPKVGREVLGATTLTLSNSGYTVISQNASNYASDSYTRPLCLADSMFKFRRTQAQSRDLSSVNFDLIRHSFVNSSRDDYNALNLHNPFIKNFNRSINVGLETASVESYFNPDGTFYNFTFVGDDDDVSGIPLGFADAGVGESLKTGVEENTMILMNLNDPAICKYYTEPTN